MLMKKKFILLMMTCLLGLFGTVKAQETITIGEGGTATDKYVPTYMYYKYSITQQIYTSDDMQGVSGNITRMEFKNYPGTQ